MEILLASHIGFCFGVKRAIDKAIEVSQNYRRVFTLGPLIHNPQEVERLERLGIRQVEELSDLESGSILLIRAHGEKPALLQKARNRGFKVIDATCPLVKKVQHLAKKLVDENYETIVIGDRNHPEVIGIVAWTGGKAKVIETKEEVQAFPKTKKLGIVAQTTQAWQNFWEIVTGLLDKSAEIKIFNTICAATAQWQKDAYELSKKVDLMLVIGGHHSANTLRLAEICKSTGTPTFHIETAAEICPEWLMGRRKIGITAGTSTPQWIIEQVRKRMEELSKELKAGGQNCLPQGGWKVSKSKG